MAHTYIAGFDGSEASRAAVRLALRLGRAEGARVIAARITPTVYSVPGRGASPALDRSLDADIRAQAEQELRETLVVDGDVERTVRSAHSPAEGLHALVEAEDAELLVVGVTHHGPVGRLAPGSVAEHALHGSPCPVAVAPADARGDSDAIGTVAVAYDRREESEAALRTAKALAHRFGATLVLITADDPRHYGQSVRAPLAELEAELRKQLDVALARSAQEIEGGLQVQTRVAIGPAGRAIVEACGDDIDLLVMGSRAYGPLRSVLLGSVSRYVVDHATCPVIVVPRGADTALEGQTTSAAMAGI